MKKLNIKKLSMIIVVLVLALSCTVNAYAITPAIDDVEDFNIDGGVEISEVDGGIRLDFNPSATLATRVAYMKKVKMDGLKIKVTNAQLIEASGIAFGLGDYDGSYEGDTSLVWINQNRTEGNGFVLGRTGLTDEKFIDFVGFTSPLPAEFEMSIDKKDDKTWVYTVNGQEMEFDNALVEESITNTDEVYLTFGTWGEGNDMEYTVTDIQGVIGADETPDPTDAPTAAPTAAPTDATPGDTTKAPETGDTTAAPAGTTAADKKDGDSNDVLKWVLPAVIVVLVVVGGFILFKFVLKPKKTDE